MHRKTAVLLAALICLTMTACGKKPNTTDNAKPVVNGVAAEQYKKEEVADLYKEAPPKATTTEAATEAETTTEAATTTAAPETETTETTTAQTETKPAETTAFTGNPEMYSGNGRGGNGNISGQQTQTETVGINRYQVQNLQASAISVGCLKITWSPDQRDTNKNREYNIQYSTNALYPENIQFVFDKNNKNVAYMTGLRANSTYNITVTPIAAEGDNSEHIPASCTGYTENPNIIWNFDYEAGWTNCFCGERASGLRGEPSRSGIAGSIADPITGTGIRRNAYGDYCCAMGTWYGYVGDRFLVTLENGIQFTTQIADSKGLADDGAGKYHWFGGAGNGKCIIEFVYNDGSLPSCVASSGSWGGYNWNGLNLGANIATIQKIDYGSTVTY